MEEDNRNLTLPPKNALFFLGYQVGLSPEKIVKKETSLNLSQSSRDNSAADRLGDPPDDLDSNFFPKTMTLPCQEITE